MLLLRKHKRNLEACSPKQRAEYQRSVCHYVSLRSGLQVLTHPRHNLLALQYNENVYEKYRGKLQMLGLLLNPLNMLV